MGLRIYPIEVEIRATRLRFLGHVQRMEKSKLPYIALHGQISEDGRREGAPPEMNFRRAIKADLLAFNISTESWMELAENRNEWRYLVLAGKFWNAIEWYCLREQERDVRYAAKGIRDTEFQTVTTNGRGTSQRRSSDRVRRRQQTLDQNPECKEVHEVVCVNDGRIVTRRGAKEFSKWNKFNALKQLYGLSHSSRMVQLLRKQQRQREPEEFAQREAQFAQ